MSNNKQQPKPENPNNQFSNTEPLTHAQRVAIANTISNNKQTIKLYTEEQVRKAFYCGSLYLGREGDTNFDQFIDKITPIELPSDEEVEKQAEHEDTYSKKCAFTRGAKWMWRKTFGGNNEQQ